MCVFHNFFVHRRGDYFLFHVFVSYSRSCLKIQNTKIRHICWGLNGEQRRLKRYQQELNNITSGQRVWIEMRTPRVGWEYGKG